MVNITKDFFKIENGFNFNDLSVLLDRNNFKSKISSNNMDIFILQSVFQVREVQNTKEFSSIFARLNKTFNGKNLPSDLDIFFSMVSGAASISHTDEYDVYIINLFGKVVYKIEDEIYNLDVGDLIHIPKNTHHQAIGLSPRIILSYGIREDLE